MTADRVVVESVLLELCCELCTAHFYVDADSTKKDIATIPGHPDLLACTSCRASAVELVAADPQSSWAAADAGSPPMTDENLAALKASLTAPTEGASE